MLSFLTDKQTCRDLFFTDVNSVRVNSFVYRKLLGSNHVESYCACGWHGKFASERYMESNRSVQTRVYRILLVTGIMRHSNYVRVYQNRDNATFTTHDWQSLHNALGKPRCTSIARVAFICGYRAFQYQVPNKAYVPARYSTLKQVILI